ncbi:MAG: hypothetical protein A2126_04845 [Candidatus Woykebacteria bacterium GWB1_45_5]|uniref:Glycosyl transferase family 1 n=1 Tax=Candidatus Woykebacteria bacterium GWB1_45_5 TaxID=1802592 RepID=A0A1G1W533_9BACT|nr:MAG: hypothetical protein A2126_04845 [Candidatus Woykebacteria bacterium GWB1_45_5]
MKIGFFTDGYLPQPNGVATSVAASAKALRDRGHNVYIVAPKEPGYKDLEAGVFRLTSIKVSNRPPVRLSLSLPEKPLREVLKIDFDIIHGHDGGTSTLLGWEIAKLKNIPFVGTYHTLWNRYTHYILKGKLIRPKVMEVASRVFASLCDYLVVPTKRVKEELLTYGVRKPIVVIPSGLDLSLFKAAPKGFLRKKFGLGAKKKILLYVGRLGQEKSIDFLLEVFKEIFEKEKDVYLVLIGDGPERKNLEQLAKKLKIADETIFTGFIDSKKIPKVYADGDIFVYSSKTETQGLVVVEALVSGLPVVALNDPAFQGVVENGKNGFLVSENSAEFANKIRQLLADKELRDKFSSTAKLAAKKFSAKETAEKLELLYQKVIAEHRAKKFVKFRTKIADLRSFFDLTERMNKLKNIISSYSQMKGF